MKLFHHFFLALVTVTSWANDQSTLQSSRPNSDRIEAARAYMTNAVATSSYPGLSYIVVDRKGVLLSGAFGTEAQGSNRPMTVDSSSAIGSITKSFTAFAVMRLVEEGKLDLDEQVITYLPWFQTARKEDSDKITLRHLLSNSSGIPSLDREILAQDVSADAPEQLARSLAGCIMTRGAGESFEYSNEGFVVAGLVASTVSGLTYPQLLDTYVLKPLGMTRSTTDPAQFENLAVTFGHYSGIGEGIAVGRNVLGMNYTAAGSLLRCSARDMGLYARALLNAGVLDGKRVLSAESLATLWTGHIKTPEKLDEEASEYALGWIVKELEGRRIVTHGGNALTMTSQMTLEPDRGRAIIILSNSESLDAYANVSMRTMSNNVLHILAGEATTDHGKPKRADITRNDYHLPAEKQAAYVGRFIADGFSNKLVQIDARGDELVLTSHDGSRKTGEALLDFLNPSRAFTRNIGSPMSIRFKTTPTGEVIGASFQGHSFFREMESDETTHQSWHDADNTFSFQLNQSWRGEWKEGRFTASRQLMTVHAGVTEHDLATFLKEVEPAQGDLATRSENISGRRWHSVAWRTETGIRAKRLLVTNLGNRHFYVLLETPALQLTRGLQEAGMDILSSVNFH